LEQQLALTDKMRLTKALRSALGGAGYATGLRFEQIPIAESSGSFEG
jgi:hypothetical protein